MVTFTKITLLAGYYQLIMKRGKIEIYKMANSDEVTIEVPHPDRLLDSSVLRELLMRVVEESTPIVYGEGISPRLLDDINRELGVE